MLVDIQFIPPTIFVDTMNQLQFRFYGGDVELDPLRKTNQITTLNPVSRRCIVIEGLVLVLF